MSDRSSRPAAAAPGRTVGVAIRPVRWPEDEGGLAAIETGFTTDLVYRVERDELAFRLVPEAVEPPLVKRFPPLLAEAERLRRMGHVVVAEADRRLVGVLAADLEAWHRRVRVEHIYVAPDARGRGVGRALVASALGFARRSGARCLWLETQNTNYGAVHFYRRLGFALCGLDERFYDPAGLDAPETALFFALDVAGEGEP
jgi:ribosomal protein S18 acetylase RimI-like enzyme